MKQCLAPCINSVDKDEYSQIINKANEVLSGSNQQLLKEMNNKMNTAAENLQFEDAIEYRNIINSII